jgi:hypothetical protein
VRAWLGVTLLFVALTACGSNPPAPQPRTPETGEKPPAPPPPPPPPQDDGRLPTTTPPKDLDGDREKEAWRTGFRSGKIAVLTELVVQAVTFDRGFESILAFLSE